MERWLLLGLLVILVTGCASPACIGAESEFRYKEDFLKRLVADVPEILKNQNPATGRFGKGIWIVQDQHPIYPLAVAWATKSDANPYYHDPKVLEAIMSGGDALIAAQDAKGMWEFRKKDNSFWGMTYMPWTYSRWIRTFALVRDAMPPEHRKRWEDALILGYTGISQTCLGHVHNIPTHHAMGLYLAGRVFDRQDWCDQAKSFMATVVAEQDPGGFWSEHYGPVVAYDFVYVDAIGTYYAMSGDEAVLPALEKATRFHANFVYPDGKLVETIDERNPYSEALRLGNVGFTFTAEGRGFVMHQFALMDKAGKGVSADDLANFILYGEEGPATPTAAVERDRSFVLGDGDALIRRKGPWFIYMSAYHCPVLENRWIQDRQNFVSIYHDKVGLIVGGGNTKLQPLWSNFTVGDISLLKHTPGDENPKFTPEGGLLHLPDAAGLKKSDPPGLGLMYGKERCSIEVEPIDDDSLRIRLRATSKLGQPVEAHVTLLPHLGKPIRAERSFEKVLGEEGWSLSSDEAGGWIEHAGWRLSLPEGSKVTWPVLPHNPYVKDGSATVGEGRIVVTLPFSADMQECVLTLSVE
jgi:hypothetical protein